MPLKSEVDYGALGIFLGKILEDKIPLIKGLKNPAVENLKQLDASLASASMVNIISGKKVRENIEFWVCASRFIEERAKNHIRKIEASGAKVLTDTCAVVTWTEKLGIKTIMTNSAKTAYYAPTLTKAQVMLAPLRECLKTALKQ